MLNIEYSLEELLTQIIEFLPTLVLGVTVFFLTLWISSSLAKRVRKPLERRGVDTELIVLLQLLTKWGFRVLGIVIAVEIIASGTLGSLIAGIGVEYIQGVIKEDDHYIIILNITKLFNPKELQQLSAIKE